MEDVAYKACRVDMEDGVYKACTVDREDRVYSMQSRQEYMAYKGVV